MVININLNIVWAILKKKVSTKMSAICEYLICTLPARGAVACFQLFNKLRVKLWFSFNHLH